MVDWKRFLQHPRLVPLALLVKLHLLSIDGFYYRVYMAENSPRLLADTFAEVDSLVEDNGTDLGVLFKSIGKRRTTYLGKLVTLYAAIRLTKPQIVIETGVEHGFSSYTILSSLKKNGKGGALHSIDLKRKTAVDELKTGHLVPAELEGGWFLHIGDSRTELPKLLKRMGEIDFFYQDDSNRDYELQMLEYRNSWEHMRPGGTVFAACASFNTSLSDFSKSVGGSLVTPQDLVPGVYPPIADWGLVSKTKGSSVTSHGPMT